MTRETDITNLVYDESSCDINRLKYRAEHYDPKLAVRVNSFLAAPKNYGYKNSIQHSITDRLLMIQEEEGIEKAIRYFSWRIEGSITKQQFYCPSVEIVKDDQGQQLHDMQQQLHDMQQLLINLSHEKSDELRQRRVKIGNI